MNWLIKNYSKYHNIKTEYNGIKYDSKKEAQFAQDLDMLKRAGEIKDWKRQIAFKMVVEGEIICRHYVDFEIEHNDGSKELVEIKSKSTMTPLWKLKKKLLYALFLKKDNLKYRVEE